MPNPYEQANSIAGAFANVGNQFFKGQAAYDAGKMKAEQMAAQQQMLGSHTNLYNAQAQKTQEEAQGLAQRRQYQNPEFSSKVAAALAGLNDSQGSELSNYQQNGNWGVNPGKELPAWQEGPPMPDMPKSAPNWYTPQLEQRVNQAHGVVLGNLAGTGNSKIDDMAKAFTSLLERGDMDAAMAGGNNGLNAYQAAMKGKMYDSTPRGILNQDGGKEAVNADWQKVQRSAAAENYAQAGNASASAQSHLASRDLTRSKIGQATVNPDGSITAPMPNAKPMPAAALKIQQEELDNLATASGINPMLQRFADDIDGGKLSLGPVSNMISKGKNFAGVSDENSKNFASFQATLEKLRNDSLRLNKGVQTDGDAVRAWNELMNMRVSDNPAPRGFQPLKEAGNGIADSSVQAGIQRVGTDDPLVYRPDAREFSLLRREGDNRLPAMEGELRAVPSGRGAEAETKPLDMAGEDRHQRQLRTVERDVDVLPEANRASPMLHEDQSGRRGNDAGRSQPEIGLVEQRIEPTVGPRWNGYGEGINARAGSLPEERTADFIQRPNAESSRMGEAAWDQSANPALSMGSENAAGGNVAVRKGAAQEVQAKEQGFHSLNSEVQPMAGKVQNSWAPGANYAPLIDDAKSPAGATSVQ